MADRRVVDIGEVEQTLKEEEEKEKEKERKEKEKEKESEAVHYDQSDERIARSESPRISDPWVSMRFKTSPFMSKTFKEMYEEMKKENGTGK